MQLLAGGKEAARYASDFAATESFGGFGADGGRGGPSLVARQKSEAHAALRFAGAAVDSNSAHGFAFFGFSADGKDLSNIYLKFNEDGSDDDLKNEWDPAKYACLSYVDWDIAPKDKTVTTSKRAAKAVSKEKEV